MNVNPTPTTRDTIKSRKISTNSDGVCVRAPKWNRTSGHSSVTSMQYSCKENHNVDFKTRMIVPRTKPDPTHNRSSGGKKKINLFDRRIWDEGVRREASLQNYTELSDELMSTRKLIILRLNLEIA